jgi:hypothetical protein
LISSPPKKALCCDCYRWLSERTMTGSPTLLPMCKCQKLPGRNWNGNKTPVGEAPGSTAMDQCIMGTVTHLHRQPQAVLQVRVVGSPVDTQLSPVPPLFQRILQFLPSTNLPLLLLQFLQTLSFLRTTPLPLWPPPSPSPPPPHVPLPFTAQNSPSLPLTPPSPSLAKDCSRWRRSWMNR